MKLFALLFIALIGATQAKFTFKSLKNKLENFGHKIESGFEDLGEKINEKANAWAEKIHLQDRVDKLENLGEGIKNKVEDFAQKHRLEERVNKFGDKLQAFQHNAEQKIKDAHIGDRLKEFEQKAEQMGEHLVEQIKAARIGDKLSSFERNVEDQFETLGGQINDKANALAAKFHLQDKMDKVNAAIQKQADKFEAAHPRLVSKVKQLKRTLSAKLQKAGDAIEDKVREAMTEAKALRAKTCNWCHAQTAKARTNFVNNEDNLEQIVIDACEYVPANLYAKCMAAVDQHVPGILSGIENGLSNNAICKPLCF